jgi:hypothetical protein
MDIYPGPIIGQQAFNEAVEATAWYRSLTERPFYQVLWRNSHRLDSMLDMYTNLERVGGNFRAIDQRATVALFMGEMVNWLAASRLYLESQRDFLVAQFGDRSEELDRFNETTARSFDSLPGYRFLYNLRDYAQHCGAPISGLLVSRNDADGRKVDMYLSKSELLAARFSWNRHARPLLDSWPEQILITPLLHEAMTGFQMVEDEVLRILVQGCANARPVIERLLARIDAEGNPAVFRLPIGEQAEMCVASLPTNDMLATVDRALAADDPLTVLRAAGDSSDSAETFSPEQRRAIARAAAVLAAFHDHDGGDEFSRVVNEVIRHDRGATPLISGLTNVAVIYSKMLAQTLGTTSESLLGAFAEDES